MAALGAGLNRVQQQVDDHVLQLGFVRPNVESCERGRQDDAHGMSPRGWIDQTGRRNHRVVQIDDIGRRVLAARHLQEVLRDAAATQQLLAGGRRALGHLRPCR